MRNGNIYDHKNITHPYLDFVGYIDPNLSRECCCSVTLVSSKHVLTAYHCVENIIKMPVRFHNEDINEIISYERVSNFDLILGTLKEEVKRITPIRGAIELCSEKKQIIIAGWGAEGEDKDDKKYTRLKWGFSEISLVSNEVFSWTKTGLSVNNGDSGGPVIVFENDELRLAGIITKFDNIGILVKDYQDTMPYSDIPLLITETDFRIMFEIDQYRREIYEKNEESADVLRSSDEWLYRQKTEE